jgi:hypothetical protein
MEMVSAAAWIDASPDAVWAVLADLTRYPEWNPLFPEATGELSAGQRVTLRGAGDGGRRTTIRPRLTAVTPAAELRWKGRPAGMPPVLITGEHTLTLKPANGGTLVLERSVYHGFMVRFSGRWLDRAEAGLQTLNGALKVRVETAEPSSQYRTGS